MRWYRPLYIGALAKKNKREIIRKIKKREFMVTACFICLALNEEELLEIYPVYTLVNKRFPADDLYIVGIAANRFEAFKLVTKIVDDVYQKTGTVDVRGYFKS